MKHKKRTDWVLRTVVTLFFISLFVLGWIINWTIVNWPHPQNQIPAHTIHIVLE